MRSTSFRGWFSGTRDIVPLLVLVRAVLTTCESVAFCGRSFSKLKLINTYLCSNVGQERLSSLAFLSIERKLKNVIALDSVIGEFFTSSIHPLTRTGIVVPFSMVSLHQPSMSSAVRSMAGSLILVHR